MTNYALPSHTGIRGVTFRMASQNFTTTSPFTYQQQVINHAGRRWEVDVTLPPMKHADARIWLAWLAKLDGSLNTFTLGDPLGRTPRGSALSFEKNLLTFTEQFDQWSKTSGIVPTANSTTAPDGNTTADTLEKTSGTFEYLRRKGTTTSGVTYTGSVYLKQGTAAETRIRLFNDTLSTELSSFIIIDWSNPAANGEAVGNGWYRFSLTAAAIDAGINIVIYPSGISADTGTVYAWGAQLEEGSVATEYQPIADVYGPFVAGASQTGASLDVDGASPDEAGYLLEGDYIQLGTGASARLYMVTDDVDTDGSGAATINVWPAITVAPADNAGVIVANTVGAFRLASNVSTWSADEAAVYGISFSGVGLV